MAPPTNNHVSSTNTSTMANDIRDGWENDEWGSLEEEPTIEELEEKANEMNHSSASRSNSNSHSHSSSGNHNNNVLNNVSPSRDTSIQNGDNLLNVNSNSISNSNNWDNYGTTWNDDFEPIEDTNAGNISISGLNSRCFINVVSFA